MKPSFIAASIFALSLSACVSKAPVYPDSMREPAAANESFVIENFACTGTAQGKPVSLSSTDRVLKIGDQTFADSDVYGLKGEEGWSGKGIVFEVTERKNETASNRMPASAKNCEATTAKKLDVVAKVRHMGSASAAAPLKEGDSIAMNCVEQSIDMAACPAN